MINQYAYWETLWADSANQNSLVFNYPHAKATQLDDESLAPIRQLAFDMLARSLDPNKPLDATTPQGQRKILEALNETTYFTVIQNLDLMAQMDTLLTQILQKKGLLNGIEGIEFPVNLRVSHPSPPPGYAEREFATDHVHCDPWTGSPSDNVNCFVYIDVESNSSALELLVADKQRLEKLAGFTGSYLLGAPLILDLEPVPYEPQPGQLIVFDAFTPHRTVRKGHKVRLSIDFRLRREDPYYATVADSRNKGDTTWSRYWYLNLGGATTFSERCEAELALLRDKENQEGLDRRLQAIERDLGHPK